MAQTSILSIRSIPIRHLGDEPYFFDKDHYLKIRSSYYGALYSMHAEIYDWLKEHEFIFEIIGVNSGAEHNIVWSDGVVSVMIDIWIHFEDPDAAFAYKLRWHKAVD